MHLILNFQRFGHPLLLRDLPYKLGIHFFRTFVQIGKIIVQLAGKEQVEIQRFFMSLDVI